MTKTFSSEQIDEAAEALRNGQLVAFPTETVYGLGADATNPEAVANIFEAKGRPVGHPLIVHIANAEQLRLWVREVPESAEKLAEAFWPGPLTMVLSRNGRVAAEAVGSKPTIAIRVPDHPVALELLASFDGGVAAPSANKFGGVSPTTAAHVVDDLDDIVDVVIDGGKCGVGVESTIVDLTGDMPVVLRPGGVSAAAIESALGVSLADDVGEARAPGMLSSHYAPNASIELKTLEEVTAEDFTVEPGTGVIASVSVDVSPSWTLPVDATAYAKNLYAVLREADARGVKKLLIVPPSEGELLEAVLDRLAKAAAPRL